MKRSTLLIVALLSLMVMCSFVPVGGNGVASLWRDYEKARAADRVDEMENALERIRRASLEQKYPWDYFEASEKYADLKISRNWKSADSIRRQTARDIEAFGLEVMNVMYALRHWELRDSVRCRLEASEKQMRRKSEKRISIRERLAKFKELIAQMPKKEKEKKKERSR